MEVGRMRFDDLLLKLGEFGRYQICIYNLVCFFIFIVPWQHFVLVFLSGNDDHWCKIPEWETTDCDQFGLNTSLQCSAAKKWVGIPSNLTSDGDLVYDKCRRYNVTGIAFSPDLDLEGLSTIACDAGWEYDVDESTLSINQEFDLVCGSGFLLSLSQSLYFAGTALGSVLIGFLADRFGRQRVIFFCLAVGCISGLAISFSVNIWMFMFLRLFAGMATVGTVTVSFVLANEFIGISGRSVAGSVIWVYFAFGYMTLALLAYFVHNWRHLQLVVSLVPALLFSFYWVLPESVRWLMVTGRKREAERIIQKIARVNKVPALETFQMDTIEETKEEEVATEKQSFVELFRKPRLRKYTLIAMFNMMVNTIVYFGLSLGTGSLGINIYVAFAVSGAVEIPAYFLIIYPIEYWGRRLPYVFFMFLGGVACLATIVIPLGPWRAAVAMVGKFAITATFSIIFLHACEIFPTSVRNSAFGFCRLCSFMSNIMCPIILLLDKYWSPLPLVIFGSLSIVAGALAVLLPETRGKKLPETLDEGENIGWKALPRRNGDDRPPEYISVAQG